MEKSGRMTAAALDELLAFDADVYSIGPGLGRSDELDALVDVARVQVAARRLVVDADGSERARKKAGKKKKKKKRHREKSFPSLWSSLRIRAKWRGLPGVSIEAVHG